MKYLNYLHSFTPIVNKLKLVEVELQRALDSDIVVIRNIAKYITHNNKGKMIRPILLLSCAYMCGIDKQTDIDIQFATIFELIHTATLIHDDIVDRAKIRRSKPTINSIWGSSAAVLFGDLIYTRAIIKAMSAYNCSFRLLNILSNAANTMIEGELIQNSLLYNLDITKEDYFNIQERKTAFLFAGSTETAGVLAGRSKADCEMLRQFGFEIGKAFQLIDDLLDYTATSRKIGKPAFSDLIGGRLTLPILNLIEQKPSKVVPIIKRIWSNGYIEEQDKEYLYYLLDTNDAYCEIKMLAELASNKASEAITNIDGNKRMKDLLVNSSKLLLKRSF